ncbi:fumarylacetoacetate hydrolase family protein [Corynebacterium incognita]|uniref:Fumarylacetoacetate hydrolase family protein n=1 Tax=Corynebacterium incognita TaxID=2754725 RepID=A0A7G7CNS9_9CORY|nr:fumarylacetoacetate hydrolase family protein [Corynebacterium incognita]QNE89245.1 fumarylacetoacetate hydrolase family protein [Corynebacterium incognita]
MKLATIRTDERSDAVATAAAVITEPIDFAATHPASGEALGSAILIPGVTDVGELLQYPDWRDVAESATVGVAAARSIKFGRKDLAPVVPRPEKIICTGLNYAKHVREMGRDFPDHPTLFIKFADALTGPFDDVDLPPFAQAQPDYEGELAVVIGQRAHQVSAAEALDYAAGYAIMNDYTLRDFQRRTTQFHQGKSFYRTAGFGPWLTTSDEWAPGNKASLITTVDGEVRQHDNTDNLIFSVAKLIEFCSHLYPLNPGDVIATGTPEGVGFAREPQAFLRNGQPTRITIEGLGQIENVTRLNDIEGLIQSN